MTAGRLAIVLLLTVALGGCVSLTDRENRRLKEIKSYNLNPERFPIKNRRTAMWLNLAPGFGNFYLAWDTGQFTGTDMWITGVTNLVCWPVSPVWAMAEGYKDAGALNTRATIDHYYHTSEGLRVIESHEAAAAARRATPLPAPKPGG